MTAKPNRIEIIVLTDVSLTPLASVTRLSGSNDPGHVIVERDGKIAYFIRLDMSGRHEATMYPVFLPDFKTEGVITPYLLLDNLEVAKGQKVVLPEIRYPKASNRPMADQVDQISQSIEEMDESDLDKLFAVTRRERDRRLGVSMMDSARSALGRTFLRESRSFTSVSYVLWVNQTGSQLKVMEVRVDHDPGMPGKGYVAIQYLTSDEWDVVKGRECGVDKFEEMATKALRGLSVYLRSSAQSA